MSRTEPALLDRETASSSAVRVVVATIGLVASLAGIEHGVGELLQDASTADGLVIESWPDVAAFEPLDGEPAMTLIPDLRIAGVVSVVTALALGWWAVRARPHRRDGWVLLGLSALLLVVGGGFGPPLVGLVLAIGLLRADPRTRPRKPGRVRHALASAWRSLLLLTVSSFLALLLGVVLLQWLAGVDSTWLPALLPPVAFGGLVLTLAGALTVDRERAREDEA